MSWTEPAAQIWHLEALLLAILVSLLVTVRTGRPAFEGLMVINLIFDIAQLISTRTYHYTVGVNVSYAWYLMACPLMAMALAEAYEHPDRMHSKILHWWVAATVACLGIRYFPYSGRALLVCNCVAYSCWIFRNVRRWT